MHTLLAACAYGVSYYISEFLEQLVYLERGTPALWSVDEVRKHIARIGPLISNRVATLAYNAHARSGGATAVGFEILEHSEAGLHTNDAMYQFGAGTRQLRADLRDGSAVFTGRYYCDTAAAAVKDGLDACIANPHMRVRLLALHANIDHYRTDTSGNMKHTLVYVEQLDESGDLIDDVLIDPTYGQTNPRYAGRIQIIEWGDIVERYDMCDLGVRDVTSYASEFKPSASWEEEFWLPAYTIAAQARDFDRIVGAVANRI